MQWRQLDLRTGRSQLTASSQFRSVRSFLKNCLGSICNINELLKVQKEEQGGKAKEGASKTRRREERKGRREEQEGSTEMNG